ncbi:MAG: hypothetical protein AB7L09_02585 [Nitrospira sp.]
MPIGPYPPDSEITPDHLSHGSVQIDGRWRPVLQRQATEEDACTNCRGFGHGGNPFIGAVYLCESCSGSGLRQPGQPAYVTEHLGCYSTLMEGQQLSQLPSPDRILQMATSWWPVWLTLIIVATIIAVNTI